MAFESTFKAIDNTLHHDDGCSTALDYVEQSSWVLFLKYFDDLENTREQAAELEEKTYERIIAGEYQWNEWAMPLDEKGNYDVKRAMVGDDLIEFVNQKLFPYLKNFTEKYDVDMPIVEGVNKILFEDYPAKDAMHDLLTRDKKAEVTGLSW